MKVRKSLHTNNRLSAPRSGRTINKVIEIWTKPLAETFSILLKSASDRKYSSTLIERYRASFNPIVPIPNFGNLSSEQELRLAVVAVLSEWVLARLAQPNYENITLEEAEIWFLGNTTNNIPGLVMANNKWLPKSCDNELRHLCVNSDCLDLLPYIFEVFDLLDVDGNMLNRTRKRAQQRINGTIYTPSDVSDYIARKSLSHMLQQDNPNEIPICIDPACGTGLFLRSSLNIIKKHYNNTPLWQILNYIYGMDISHQAIQSCAFVLLACALRDVSYLPVAPWSIWQFIRGNLAVVDSTQVTTLKHKIDNEDILQIRNQIKLSLLSSEPPIRSQVSNQPHFPIINPLPLQEIFPEATDGFDTIIGNPPYSRLYYDGYQGIRNANYETAPINGKTGLSYPLFVEMMWRFANPRKASGGIILPMSIAYSKSTQIQRLRKAIQGVHGDWRFTFFDRTPDSLFGDDVKTRNAVILWDRNTLSKRSRILTGPLLKWNSRNRNELFDNINNVDLGTGSINEFIPKLGTILELESFNILQNIKNSLGSMLTDVPISNLTPGMENSRYVIINSTAYNWISTFRIVPASQSRNADVDVPPSVRAFICETEENADFVFACLNSRLTYWLWRVESDCFHINNEFIRRLPFHISTFPQSYQKELRELSRNLWSEMQHHQIKSVNAGRTRISYYPYICYKILDNIDSILIKNLEIPNEFLPFLNRFVINNIVAGRYNELQTNPALKRIKAMENTYEKIG